MLCLTRTRTRTTPEYEPEGAGLRPATTVDPGIRLAGTWDFKWPRRSEIRVAFLDGIDPAKFAAARDAVITLARAWQTKVITLDRTWSGDGSVPLTLRFVPELVSLGGPFVGYDVLISLQPLPIDVPATNSHPASQIFGARSQLGTYAKRVDYAVPTTYIGPPPRAGSPDPFSYYASPEGRHVVTHEIGHILGLGHAHQNPRVRQPPVWKDADACIDVLYRIAAERLAKVPDARNVLREFVERQIRNPWDDSGAFSDWPSPEVVDEASVMIYPTYKCMLSGYAMDCTQQADCLCMRFNETPSPQDLDWLRSLYRRTQAIQQPASAAQVTRAAARAPGRGTPSPSKEAQLAGGGDEPV